MMTEITIEDEGKKAKRMLPILNTPAHLNSILFFITAIILKKFEKRIIEVFEVFDHTGSKSIDIREIPTVLSSLGKYCTSPTHKKNLFLILKPTLRIYAVSGCVPSKAEMNEIIQNIQEPECRGNIHLSKFLPFVSNLILKYK